MYFKTKLSKASLIISWKYFIVSMEILFFTHKIEKKINYYFDFGKLNEKLKILCVCLNGKVQTHNFLKDRVSAILEYVCVSTIEQCNFVLETKKIKILI